MLVGDMHCVAVVLGGKDPDSYSFAELQLFYPKPQDQSFLNQKGNTMKLLAPQLAWTQRFAALAIILFWASFWANHNQLPPNVVNFEWCFLLPDLLWIVGAFALASHWLIARDPRAGVATAVAGSSLAYLGLLDAACNFRHGQYTGSHGALNVAINLACLAFGCANIWYTARRT